MKSRLRHPVRAIREPFGKAGLIVAMIALVLALTGAAFAAGGLTAKEKKEVKTIAKSLVGTGPAGAQGPAGPAGSQGAAGAQGAPGAAGTGVTNAVEPKGTHCKEGGTKFEGTSVTYACNGSPWTAGGTLPSGQIETGTWAGMIGSQGASILPISFPIPLPGEIENANVHVMKEGEEGGEGCTGGTASTPTVGIEKGTLCIYVFGTEATNVLAVFKAGEGDQGASTMGARLLVIGPDGEGAFGTFAVRAQ
jgi:hypothetical protein